MCGGVACGTVLRFVIDPATSTVTHLAVGPKHGGGRLVPFTFVAPTEQRVELSCTQAEFDSCLSDQDGELIADAADDFAQMTPNHPDAAILSVYDEIAPVGITRQFPRENAVPRTTTFDRVPRGEEQLKPEEQVQATDGPVGHVSGLAVDPTTGRISHLLVDAGHLWKRRQLAIPMAKVDHLGIAVLG
jgi:sporulation protein YlmC with PRC-barrel domain